MKRARLFFFAAVVMLGGLLPQAVFAAAPGQAASPNSNMGYLLAGTIAVWAGFFVYAFYIARKNRDLRRELEDLRAKKDRDRRSNP